MTTDPSLLPDDDANRTLRDRTHPPTWTNSSPKPRYHLVVLGAGTAGLTVASTARRSTAASHGLFGLFSPAQILPVIAPYLPPSFADAIRQQAATVVFLDYAWSLSQAP